MPPGMPANADPVVAAKRAAEKASVRKVRDMVEAPERRCAPRSVTKVWQDGKAELPECKCLRNEGVPSPLTLWLSYRPVIAPVPPGTSLPPERQRILSPQP